MNEYQKMIKESMQNRDNLTRKQYKQIKNLYKEAAKDLKIKSDKARKGSLTERWAKDYRKAVKSEIRQVNTILFKQILDNIVKSANLAAGIQLNFFNLVDKKYKLNMSKSFTNMFSKVPNDAVEELIKGNIYKDGRGLSKRIWWTSNKANGDIDKIIQKGIAEKKSAYELAQDLQEYVDPDSKKDWQWKKVYPGTAKTIDYNAQRLARTSISHAYTLALLKSCECNPFITKVRWHSVFAPGRTCSLCKDRDGREYLLKDCPMDHPNGMCYQEPLIDDSLENIGSRLRNWVNGNSDTTLDNWYKEYGDYFSGNDGASNTENNSNNNSENDNKNNDNSDTIDTEESIRKNIKNGKYPLDINVQAQNKHIVGTNDYKEGKSTLNISIDEAQDLVNKYAGTGTPIIVDGDWKGKERIIDNDNAIGVYKDGSGNSSNTSNFMIHYNYSDKKQKRGTHIVPSKP